VWTPPAEAVESTTDYSVYILFGVSVIGLIAAGVAGVLRRKKDDDTDE